jgi:UDP-4-amino-4-deoxy-L-arabinose formyltransferase/UDP-glucuronic acid dehydrogenase (UDP-4-keto-hexauronic acid decarboxylating)
MKLAIIGRTEALYNLAKYLIEKKYDVVLIITSKEAVEYTKGADDFKILAEKHSIQFLKTSNQKELLKAVESFSNLDLGISYNYTMVIPENVIKLFSIGVLNAHGGDLPRYRGNACQAWAILNAETRIGLCIHKMVGGELDSGDIMDREFYNIDITTTITSVHNWMYGRIPEMYKKVIDVLKRNPTFVLEKQSTVLADSLRCYPRLPEDGRINWKRTNKDILRLINASNKPYQGAYFFIKETKVIVWGASLCLDEERYLAEPGQVTRIGYGYVDVATGQGKIRIENIEVNNGLIHPDKYFNTIRSRFS